MTSRAFIRVRRVPANDGGAAPAPPAVAELRAKAERAIKESERTLDGAKGIDIPGGISWKNLNASPIGIAVGNLVDHIRWKPHNKALDAARAELERGDRAASDAEKREAYQAAERKAREAAGQISTEAQKGKTDVATTALEKGKQAAGELFDVGKLALGVGLAVLVISAVRR